MPFLRREPSADAPAPVGLKTYLMRLFWLGLLPLLLLATWLAYSHVRSQQAAQDREATHVGKAFANAVDQHLRTRIRALNSLATSPLLDDPVQWPLFYQQAQGIRESFGAHVIVADTGEPMRMLMNTRLPLGAELPPLPKPKGHAAAPAAVATRQPAVGDSFIGPVAKQLLVAVAVPALRQDRVTYVVLSTFEARQFEEVLRRQALPSGWAMTLRDGRGDVIVQHAPPGFDAAKAVAPDGRFQTALAQSPWTVTVEIPRSAQLAPLMASGLALALGLLVATLSGVFGSMVASGRLSRAVASLTKDGPPDQGAGTGIVEINAVRQRLDASAASERESEARFRRLFQEAPVAMGLADRGGAILAMNTRFTQIFGYTLDDVPTLDDWWRLAYPDPDYRERVQRSWSQSMARSGESPGSVPIGEYRVSCKDCTVRTVQFHACVLTDGLLASMIDVTERVQAKALILNLNTTLEHRVAERTAELSLANRELDSFAYTVSHDLRAPLRAMEGFSQLLVAEHSGQLNDDARHCLSQIIASSSKMEQLIAGILTLSRCAREDLRRSTVDLSALVAARLTELARQDPARRVATEVQPGLLAEGDARLLDVVITNLVDNAWKYTAKTTAPRIRFWADPADDGQTWYCLADNGAGFNPAHASQLFQPFKRLHRQDEFVGIGIGLATVQRIVQRHGGEIRADGEPGRGVTFRFTLPAAASGTAPEAAPADQGLPDAHDAARPSKNAFSR